MSYQTIAYFVLKCPVCGEKDERPAADCQGYDAPTCKKCYGIPMMLDTVKKKRVKVLQSA